MELIGIVHEILERRISPDRKYAYNSFVIQHGRIENPDFALFEVTSSAEKPLWKQMDIKVGEVVTVFFNLRATKGSQTGQWFSSNKVWKVEKGQRTSSAPSTPVPQQQPVATPMAQPQDKEEQENLPF